MKPSLLKVRLAVSRDTAFLLENPAMASAYAETTDDLSEVHAELLELAETARYLAAKLLSLREARDLERTEGTK